MSPLQGSSRSIDLSKMILRCIIVEFFGGLFSPRWAHYRNGCVKIGMDVIVRLVCVVVVRGFAFVGKIPLLRSSKMCFND